jgi:hypothetical protein
MVPLDSESFSPHIIQNKGRLVFESQTVELLPEVTSLLSCDSSRNVLRWLFFYFVSPSWFLVLSIALMLVDSPKENSADLNLGQELLARKLPW